MKKLLFLIALFLTFNLFAQEQPFVEKANDLIQTAVNKNQLIGIASGFSIDGEVKWQAGAGFSDVQNKIVFDTNTITRIASISKMMTATAILQLVEKGMHTINWQQEKLISKGMYYLRAEFNGKAVTKKLVKY